MFFTDSSLSPLATVYLSDKLQFLTVVILLTFREVLLIGGENVKSQVQMLNDGVSILFCLQTKQAVCTM